MNKIEALRIFDGTLSIRVGGREVYTLPQRSECDERHITKALEAVAERVAEDVTTNLKDVDPDWEIVDEGW